MPGDVCPYMRFTLGDLDFGWDLTRVARAYLNNIEEATGKHGIREYAAVTSWLAAVACVSREDYPKWDPGERGPFVGGISSVWQELEKIGPLYGSLQHAQPAAVKIFVGSSDSAP